MILLDTTVLIGFIRAPADPVREVLRRNRIAITGVTRAEVLHGARSDRDLERLARALDTFHQIPIEPSTWDQLGRNLHTLRRRGIAVPFPDAVIATLAIAHTLPVWTHDAHFTAIQTALPHLKLFPHPA